MLRPYPVRWTISGVNYMMPPTPSGIGFIISSRLSLCVLTDSCPFQNFHNTDSNYFIGDILVIWTCCILVMAVQLICNENDVIWIDDMSNNGGGVLAALVAVSLKHHFKNFVVQNTAMWLSIIASNIGKCLHKSTHFNYLYITCYKYYFLFNISYSPIPLYFCKYVFNSYHPYHTRVRQENTSQVHICIYTYIYIYICIYINTTIW